MILNIICGFIAALLCAGALDDEAGLFIGGVLGVLFAMLIKLKRRVSDLSLELEFLKKRVADIPRPPEKEEKQSVREKRPKEEKKTASPKEPPPIPKRDEKPKIAKVIPLRPEIPEEDFSEAEQSEQERIPASRSPELSKAIKAFFSDGNLLVRAGMLVLFFGVAFLIKLA